MGLLDILKYRPKYPWEKERELSEKNKRDLERWLERNRSALEGKLRRIKVKLRDPKRYRKSIARDLLSAQRISNRAISSLRRICGDKSIYGEVEKVLDDVGRLIREELSDLRTGAKRDYSPTDTALFAVDTRLPLLLEQYGIGKYKRRGSSLYLIIFLAGIASLLLIFQGITGFAILLMEGRVDYSAFASFAALALILVLVKKLK
jgi:hypothetical protein